MEKQTRQKVSAVGANWTSNSVFDQRGQRTLTMWDRDLLESNDEYVPSQCRRVILHLDESNTRSDGTPTREEFFRLVSRERNLVERLEAMPICARLSARRAHGGKMEMIFHVDDVDAFDEAVAEWMMEELGGELVELRMSSALVFFDNVVLSVAEQSDDVRTTQPIDYMPAAC